MKAAVIVFPGSNCDRDVFTVMKSVWGSAGKVTMVWHGDSVLPAVDLVVLPGGFSYGDYLRSGAMAARSPIMKEVKLHAQKGGFVLGICNGFQILTEAGLLPGTLMQNAGLKFICKESFLKVISNDAIYTAAYEEGEVVNIPIAHHEGNYFADPSTIAELEDAGRVAFRYCDEYGTVDTAANPNGSLNNIAGVLSANKRILGMMPHPERRADADINSNIDGAKVFSAMLGKCM